MKFDLQEYTKFAMIGDGVKGVDMRAPKLKFRICVYPASCVVFTIYGSS